MQFNAAKIETTKQRTVRKIARERGKWRGKEKFMQVQPTAVQSSRSVNTLWMGQFSRHLKTDDVKRVWSWYVEPSLIYQRTKEIRDLNWKASFVTGMAITVGGLRKKRSREFAVAAKRFNVLKGLICFCEGMADEDPSHNKRASPINGIEVLCWIEQANISWRNNHPVQCPYGPLNRCNNLKNNACLLYNSLNPRTICGEHAHTNRRFILNARKSGERRHMSSQYQTFLLAGQIWIWRAFVFFQYRIWMSLSVCG